MTLPLLAPMPERIACASCGADISTAQVVAARDYHCNACHAELAHLDLAPNGMVRSVLGWLRAPGDVLHERYRIRGFLGKGGFAATYLVEDQRLNGKRRAAKEIPEIFFDERETEILSRIQHPCVPDITDRFTSDGMVYLVLEFGGDRTLETVRVSEGGRIALAKLRPWIEQLCDALAYLHAQSPPIVHRDLKPANILLDEADRVMLIDFGIAKEATPDMMTRTIARSASHGFSPPEQVLGTGTDQRSDVYALGATMYALLTGQIPPPAHERVSGADVVPPRQIAPEIPLPVEEAILRALELNVAKRQSTVEEFRRTLGDRAAVAAQSVRTTAAPRTVAIAGLELDSAAAAPAAVAPAEAAIPRAHPEAGIRAAWLAAAIIVLALLIGVIAWKVFPRNGGEPTRATEEVVVTLPPVVPTAVVVPPSNRPAPDGGVGEAGITAVVIEQPPTPLPPPGPSPSDIFNANHTPSRAESPEREVVKVIRSDTASKKSRETAPSGAPGLVFKNGSEKKLE